MPDRPRVLEQITLEDLLKRIDLVIMAACLRVPV